MSNLRSDIKILPLSTEHAQQTLLWVEEPKVRHNVGVRNKASIEKTIEWIEKTNSSNEIHAFAILKEEVHIGNVILDKYDSHLSMARFSIYIGDIKHRGAGIGRTATYLICNYGFQELSLNKIWLTVHIKNFQGINAYTNIGFQLEGILRDEFLLNGERIDVLYMGLLKEHFQKLQFFFV